MSEEPGNPLVYVPEGARLNKTENSESSPDTEYEKRRQHFDREILGRTILKRDRGNYDRNGS